MSNDEYWRDERERQEAQAVPSKYGYVVKECKRCYTQQHMSTDHGICDACASAAERGWEY